MRLTNLGAGEYADRLTILALKLHHATAAGKPTDHFINEQVDLLLKMRAKNGMHRYIEHWLELGVVNGELWRITDRIRAVKAEPKAVDLPDAAELAFRILELNDRRADLIDAINKITGEWLGAEKAHAEDQK